MAASSTQSGGARPTTWIGHEGAASLDLRSDTMTTPTAAMLEGIRTATLLDDVTEEDTTTASLEAHVAALAGKEAGLFVLSGTMGNQVALRSLLTQPPHAVLCDHRSHIVQYEGGGVSSLTGATLQQVTPSNGLYLTLEDIQKYAVISDDVHACPTRVISLENSLNGLITPLSEIRRIADWARRHDIRMHCDGARLWEVVAAVNTNSNTGEQGPSLADFAACFDTVSLCFSKGLGAPIGSILVGPARTLRHARRVRKALGGGLRQAGVVAAAARVAVDTTFGNGSRGEGNLLRASHETARRVEAMWTAPSPQGPGGKVAVPVQTNMVWLDLASAGITPDRFEKLAADHGLRIWGNRIITHYQVGEEALRRLTEVFAKVAAEKEAGGAATAKDGAGGAGAGTGPYGAKP